jgi:hypothetical protein
MGASLKVVLGKVRKDRPNDLLANEHFFDLFPAQGEKSSGITDYPHHDYGPGKAKKKAIEKKRDT